jgi:hypothetical protein
MRKMIKVSQIVVMSIVDCNMNNWINLVDDVVIYETIKRALTSGRDDLLFEFGIFWSSFEQINLIWETICEIVEPGHEFEETSRVCIPSAENQR